MSVSNTNAFLASNIHISVKKKSLKLIFLHVEIESFTCRLIYISKLNQDFGLSRLADIARLIPIPRFKYYFFSIEFKGIFAFVPPY